MTSLATPATIPAESNVADIQRRTLRLLFVTQIIGGVGQAIGSSVGALLAAEMASVAVSGLASSATVVGAALLAVPASRLVRRSGRAASLAAAYLVAALGASIVVTAAVVGSIPLLFAGYLLFGGASAAAYQARYTAVDLAPPSLRGRHLSFVIWATTLGAVTGPNLSSFAGALLRPYGIPPLAAPYAVSAALLTVAAAALWLFLRPDPIRVARSLQPNTPTGSQHVGVRAAFDAVVATPSARLGIAAAAVGHMVMVGVMAMTPVHIRGAGHGPAETLRLVGIVLSLHVAGMYACAPIMGWLTDRLGRRPVIAIGVVILLAACAVSGTAGHDATRLAIGLWLLGLGWSATMVSGSTLLSESMPAELRPSAQGLSDLVMGLAGATAGAASGLIVQGWGYRVLTLAAACITLPLALTIVRRTRSGAA